MGAAWPSRPCSGVDVVFCGNPGIGKSTLLSSLSGLPFESGVCYGSGLTSELKFLPAKSLSWPDTRFGDTPGLADIDMADKAAAAIVEAFRDSARRHRKVKIIFIVGADAGRVRRADVFTIKQVMGSIVLRGGAVPGPDSYGVIFNKCDFLDQTDFDTMGKASLESILGTKTEAVPFTTSFQLFLPLVPELSAASNQMREFPGLTNFVDGLPGIEGIQTVRDIDVRSLDEQMEALAQQYEREVALLQCALKGDHLQQVARLRLQAERKRRLKGSLPVVLVLAVAAFAAKRLLLPGFLVIIQNIIRSTFPSR